MENKVLLGRLIREKRLLLNLTMDEVSRKANITRATLSSIENGSGNYSIDSLFDVLTILSIDLKLDQILITSSKKRATRINTINDKNINRFIIMCVEQYALFSNKSGKDTYKILLVKGIVKELKEDYEDLHGMSTLYINDHISRLLGVK